MKDLDAVIDRVWQLRQLHEGTINERGRIKAIMNGGADGLVAMMGENVRALDYRVPAANLVLSGITRLGQKLGRMPNVKVDPPRKPKESYTAKQAAAKRGRIFSAYDEMDRRELQLPQLGRWLPGYGFGVFIIKEKMRQGHPYPHAELRDPYDCYPGYWTPDQQPDDLAIIRRVPRRHLARQYPQYASDILAGARTSAGGVLLVSRSGGSSWENYTSDGIEVAEYYDEDGLHFIVPDKRLELSFVQNPMPGEPQFVVPKRFAFDKLAGQYDQVIGLAAAMVKQNMMTMLAMEDAVFTETNVYGDRPFGGVYKKGRDSVNYFPPGTAVEKPIANIPYQLFQEIDRMERQFRQVAGYSVQDDANSPLSYATGRGLNELQAAVSLEVDEYQRVMKWALQDVDHKMARWDETYYGGRSKPMEGVREGVPFMENYDPAMAFAGNYRSRRVYGVMAGIDEPTFIITALQLLQAEVLDVETVQENLSGLDNPIQIQERLARKGAIAGLDAKLAQAALDPQNPENAMATMALVQIAENPHKKEEILRKFFTPEEPQPSQEEEALVAAAGGGGAAELPDADSVTTVLSRLQGTGVEGGVQTVGTF